MLRRARCHAAPGAPADSLRPPLAAPPPAPRAILASLANLHQLLSRSPLGAVPIAGAGSEHEDEEMGAAIARTSTTVQAQFRQRQRAKEGAEIVASVLGAT